MAATVVPVTVPTRAGTVDPTAVTGNTVDGNSVVNDGKTLVRMTNSDSSTHTVALPFVQTVDGQTVTARSYSLTAGQVKWAGPFSRTEYGSTLVFTPVDATVHFAAFKVGAL